MRIFALGPLAVLLHLHLHLHMHMHRYVPYALGGGYVLGKSLVDFIATNTHMVSSNYPPFHQAISVALHTSAGERHNNFCEAQND